MGISVVVTDPAELERIRERESDITKERIQKILGAGANVVLTTKGIDDMSLKYFVEAGVIACRRVSKEDMKCVLLPLCERVFAQFRRPCMLLSCAALSWQPCMQKIAASADAMAASLHWQRSSPCI